jgi:hypothetical protein
LIGAALEGRLDVVQCLIAEFGADTNQADADGWTLVLTAAQYGRVKMVWYLIKDALKLNAHAIFKWRGWYDGGGGGRYEGAFCDECGSILAWLHCP